MKLAKPSVMNNANSQELKNQDQTANPAQAGSQALTEKDQFVQRAMAQNMMGPMGFLQMQAQQQVRTIFDPEIVERYNAIVPGAAERIIKILEENNKVERELRLLPFAETKRRDYMGFTVILILIVASILFAAFGRYWFSGGSFTLLVSLLVVGFFHKKIDKKQIKPN